MFFIKGSYNYVGDICKKIFDRFGCPNGRNYNNRWGIEEDDVNDTDNLLWFYYEDLWIQKKVKEFLEKEEINYVQSTFWMDTLPRLYPEMKIN